MFANSYIMITVALVDDHVITRRGLKTVLELSEEVKVICEASNGRDLFLQLSSSSQIPDILILDICMPVMNGLETIDIVRDKFPQIKVLLFSLFSEEDTIINMISRGASGYISKSADPLVIIDAINAINSVGYYLGDFVRKEYFKRQKDVKSLKSFYGKEIITERELEFIRLAASNKTYYEIAQLMEIRPKTLENYRDSLFQKLGINNRAALVVFAYKNCLIS